MCRVSDRPTCRPPVSKQWGGRRERITPSSANAAEPRPRTAVGTTFDILRGFANMLIDGRSLSEGEVVRADLCIVGAGPAGISLACELMGRGLSIVLLESGGEKENADADRLNDGRSTSAKYAPLDMYRRRVLGGASSIWGGRIVPYDAIDFEERDWVPASGWPFPKSELAPWYDRAAPYFEIGEPEFDARRALAAFTPFIQGFDDPDILSTSFERFSAPTNLWRTNRKRLIAAADLRVVTNATCRELVCGDRDSRIDHAEIATIGGPSWRVEAARFVVACGGIETYRLLAGSDRAHPAGLGNRHDNLGRWFMSHIEGSIAHVRLRDPRTPIVWDFERSRDGVYGRRRFTVAEGVQRRERVLNFMVRLHHEQAADPRHGHPVLSTMFFAKNFILPEYRRKISMLERATQDGLPRGWPFWSKHLSNIVLGSPGLSRFLVDWIIRRHVHYRRVPYVALPSARGLYPIDFNAEQAPDRDSRLILGDERDRNGKRLAIVDWKMSELDVRSIVRNFELFRAGFARSGVADFEYDPDDLAERIRTDTMPVGGHFIGEARMSLAPRDGVVDPNLRVHDIDNLWVVGAPVLPTSSHANPTHTIVALALRLADHLGSI